MNNNKQSTKLLHLPSIGFHFDIYFLYWLSLALSILFGFILRIIYIPDKSLKLSFISGFKFIKNRLFFISISLNILFIFWILYIFSTNNRLRSNFDRSLIKYLKKLRCAFCFSNILLYISYYILKNHLFIPLRQFSIINLNIETLDLIIFGAMLNHLFYLCETFLSNRINIQLMTYFCLLIALLLIHNVYCLLWISWIDCSLRSLTFAFIISCGYVAVIQMCSIDYIVLILFETKKSNKKEKDILYLMNE